MTSKCNRHITIQIKKTQNNINKEEQSFPGKGPRRGPPHLQDLKVKAIEDETNRQHHSPET
jgi:hypothetical protein